MGTVRFPLRIMTEPQQGASYEDLLAVAREAETLGFEGFFRSDHYARIGGDPAGPEALPGPTDAWVTLGGLARETAGLRLGTLVSSATFRLPGPLTISAATVDAMSGGRVELGLGTGWFEAEHRAYGIPFPSLAERFDRLEEQLVIVTGLWRTPQGERFSFEGRHYQLTDAPALPKPLQRPHPPLIVGGSGRRRTPALAARFASELNVVFPTRETFEAATKAAAQACEAVGRDPATLAYSAFVTLCCGADEADFSRRAAAIGEEPADLRRRSVAAGTAVEVADGLASLFDAGARRLYLQVLDLADLDHLRLVTSDVAPRLG